MRSNQVLSSNQDASTVPSISSIVMYEGKPPQVSSLAVLYTTQMAYIHASLASRKMVLRHIYARSF